MEYVVAGQLFDLLTRLVGVARLAGHLFAANDAYSVRVVAQLFRRHIGIHDVEIADGASRHDHIVERFLERAQRQVHGSYGEERKRVYLDHERHECQIEEDTHEAQHQVAVEHVDAFVLPGVRVLQVDGVQRVFYESRQYVDE